RQLWWGHRIPVWYCPDGHMTPARADPSACGTCGASDLTQDPDVLDTWFSSGLWPFSTLGWPEATADLKYFYPTSVMETGYDILFFWVARMIMMGLEFTGQAPFHTVYLHGLIRDDGGHKMSKTSGNVIDPLHVMDELGTDALRFTLLVGSAPGNDTNLSVKKVEANRNFANKIWNAGRFVISAVQRLPEGTRADPAYTLADSWIWARLQQLVRDVERLFQTHQYGEAGRQIYDFFWSDFADWYVEVAKQQMQNEGLRGQTVANLARVLDLALRMLHPFTPFVTEEIWGHLRRALLDSPIAQLADDWPEALIIARWPEVRPAQDWEQAKIADFELLQGIVRSIRNLRAEKNIPPRRRLQARIGAGARAEMLKEQAGILAVLAGLEASSLTIETSIERASDEEAVLVIGPVEIHLPLAGMVDGTAERQRISQELADSEAQIRRLEQLLASEFSTKAPESVVARERARLEALRETAGKLGAQIKS
ncbi:MAG TPA: class I tRNA ligase family protein, partial [Anaerolineales bacterium]|nr:class I tRNA ligase family protein [Anaerolineales bacterium]